MKKPDLGCDYTNANHAAQNTLQRIMMLVKDLEVCV